MASLIRNVTNHFGSTSSKTSDVQLSLAVEKFQDERGKLHKFERELNRYLEAVITFDNATSRFFDALRSLQTGEWLESTGFDTLCREILNVRNNHWQRLKEQITEDVDLTSQRFDGMKLRIDRQAKIEDDYNRTNRNYRSAMKSENRMKTDQLRNQVDQLKSSLASANESLNRELPLFQRDIKSDYEKTIRDVVEVEAKFYKAFYKKCSGFAKKLKKASTNTNGTRQVPFSSVDGKRPDLQQTTRIQKNPKQFKVLYEATVIQDYHANNDDELTLIKGERVSIIDFQDGNESDKDEGWGYAQKKNGACGLIPLNFVNRIYENVQDSDDQN